MKETVEIKEESCRKRRRRKKNQYMERNRGEKIKIKPKIKNIRQLNVPLRESNRLKRYGGVLTSSSHMVP
jgi:hypothetical protein